jgi:hypothetical protein
MRNMPHVVAAAKGISPADFLQADQLITRDIAFYQRNFPELRLYPLSL